MHDEGRLPLWAQDLIAGLRRNVARLQAVEAAHAVLFGREWHVLNGPKDRVPGRDFHQLFTLERDGALPVVTVYEGDVLLVGRSRARWGAKPAPGDPVTVEPYDALAPLREAWLDMRTNLAGAKPYPTNEELARWAAQLYDACKRIQAADGMPASDEEVAMWAQVLAGTPLGTIE